MGGLGRQGCAHVVPESLPGTLILVSYEVDCCFEVFILTLFAVQVAFACKYFCLTLFSYSFLGSNWPHKPISANISIFSLHTFKKHIVCFINTVWLGT